MLVEQKKSLAFIKKNGTKYNVTVLQGVTGSGKTLVYFERIKNWGDKGVQAVRLLAEIALSNQFAPEHLQVCVKSPEKILNKINNAGSIFLGAWTPEAMGDYLAGPNHVLPTSGTANFHQVCPYMIF